MKFNEQYLTYNEYRELGGTLKDESAFNLLEYECRKKLDLRTLRRLTKLETQPLEVKHCMRSLIDKVQIIHENNQKNSGNISSESVGSYSVSYATGSQIQEIINLNNSEMDNIITENLFGLIVDNQSVLYIGVGE